MDTTKYKVRILPGCRAWITTPDRGGRIYTEGEELYITGRENVSDRAMKILSVKKKPGPKSKAKPILKAV